MVGVILGGWMAFEGLHHRLFAEALAPSGVFFALGGKLGLSQELLAWPLLVAGTSWFGALCALRIRLTWGTKIVWVVGLVSLFFAWAGTALALIALACAGARSTRRWFTAQTASLDG